MQSTLLGRRGPLEVFKSRIAAIKHFVHTHKKWEPLVFFVAGFTFDAILLHRIDDPLMLIHQASYLSLSAGIIAWDLFCEAGKASVPNWFQKVWSLREGILHFFLGTLLNVYTIFYFKSGTILSSLVFLLILAVLLFLNEARPGRISKHALRNGLFGLCLVSYINILVPIFAGMVGGYIFLAAIGCASALMYLFIRGLSQRLEPKVVNREIRIPFLLVTLVYIVLYALRILPPVPLSAKHMGIYRDVAKVGEHYRLGHTRPVWKFWESGDQTFEAGPGDKIVCFIQIFSPTRFRDQLVVRWQFKDPRAGWTHSDAIPLNIVGGREDGFRGYSVKSNYQPGDWRVSVETSDGREIGRIGLTVVSSATSVPSTEFELR